MKFLPRLILTVLISLSFTPAFSAEKPVLTVYTYDSFSSDWGPGPKIKAAFEAQCNCELKFIATDSSTGILSRVQLEGETSPADIVLGLDATQLSAARATGLLTTHHIDASAGDQRDQQKHGWFETLPIAIGHDHVPCFVGGQKLQSASPFDVDICHVASRNILYSTLLVQ